MSHIRDQTIALAGMFQSLALVQDTARTGGGANAHAFETCIRGILRVDPSSAMNVFGSPGDLRLGLITLLAHLERRLTPQHLEQARYAANLMFLERRLHAERAISDALGNALRDVQTRMGERDADDAELIGALAQLYVERVSPLGPRVMVNGEPAHLKRESTAARIRALLLAGLRAAVLWRQCGGGRLALMLRRRRYASAAAQLIAQQASDDA